MVSVESKSTKMTEKENIEFYASFMRLDNKFAILLFNI